MPDGDSGCRQIDDPPPWQLLFGIACPPPGFEAKRAYYPSYELTKAGYRMLNRWGDRCSHVASNGKNFDFYNACDTHDYGYDLARVDELKGSDDKAEVDGIFLSDMYADCRDRSEKSSCERRAKIYYSWVVAYGSFDSPF